MDDNQTPLERAAGRFGPGRQFFLCTTEEQVTALEELGFVCDPATLADPYAPEEAKHIDKMDDLVFDVAEEVVEKALEAKPAKKRAKVEKAEPAPSGNNLVA